MFNFRFLLIASALFLVGCNGKQRDLVVVQGRVTYQGEPVAGGTIHFTPTEMGIGAKQRPSTCVIDKDGAFRVQSYRDSMGLPPGNYLVSVRHAQGSLEEPDKVVFLLPQKFSDPHTSGLKATIPAGSEEILNLDFPLE
jgi:hypothetical protein